MSELDDFARNMQQRYQQFLALDDTKRIEIIHRHIGEIISFARQLWQNQDYTIPESYDFGFKYLLTSIRKLHPILFNELFAVANQVIQDYTTRLVKAGDLLLVGSFSNRLHKGTDVLAMKQNLTHSFFHDLPYFSLHLREFYQPRNINVVFNPVLLTDVVADLQPGEYMMSLLTGSDKHAKVKCPFDHSKIASLLVISHNLANRFPHDSIRLVLMEDKAKIIEELIETFENAERFLPHNIVLDICRLCDDFKHVKHIPGTGRINPHYARDVRHLLALSIYQTKLENPQATSVNIYESVDFREYYVYLEYSAGQPVKCAKITEASLYDEVFFLILRHIIYHHGKRLMELYGNIKSGTAELTNDIDNFYQQLVEALNNFSIIEHTNYDEVETDEFFSQIYHHYHEYFNLVAPKFIAHLLYFVNKEDLMDYAIAAQRDNMKGVMLHPDFTDINLIADLHYLTYFLNDAEPVVFFMLDRRPSGTKLAREIRKSNLAERSHEPIPAEPNERKTHLTYNSLINFFGQPTKSLRELPPCKMYLSSPK